MDTDRLLSDNTKLGVPSYGASQPIMGGPNMELPNEDLHENVSQTQPMPTAPPVALMDRVAGYDNMQFDNCKSYRYYTSICV